MDSEEEPLLDATDIQMLAILATAEEMLPGFTDRCIWHVEHDGLHQEIRRIGSAAPDPKRVAEERKAVKSLRAKRFVVLAHVGAKKKRKGRA